MKQWEAPTLVGSLERANLNHWMTYSYSHECYKCYYHLKSYRPGTLTHILHSFLQSITERNMITPSTTATADSSHFPSDSSFICSPQASITDTVRNNISASLQLYNIILQHPVAHHLLANVTNTSSHMQHHL
jgi:hypothetical protein